MCIIVYVKMVNFSKLFRPWFGMDLFLLTPYFLHVMFLQHFVQGINHWKSKAGEREFGFHLTFFNQPYVLFIFGGVSFFLARSYV